MLSSKREVFRDVLNGCEPVEISHMSDLAVEIVNESVEAIGDAILKICLTNACLCPSTQRITGLLGGNTRAAKAVTEYLRCRSFESVLREKVEGGVVHTANVAITIDSKPIACTLAFGTHVFYSTAERVVAGAPA